MDDPGLCDGDFAKNCLTLAQRKCSMVVGEVSASIQGDQATCSYTCGHGQIAERESCSLGGQPPIAACLFPACPENCLSCQDLHGGRECEFILGAISDDPDPVGDGMPTAPVGGRWVCE